MKKNLKQADTDILMCHVDRNFCSVSYIGDSYLFNILYMPMMVDGILKTNVYDRCFNSYPIFFCIKKKSLLFKLLKFIWGHRHLKSAWLKGYQGFLKFYLPAHVAMTSKCLRAHRAEVTCSFCEAFFFFFFTFLPLASTFHHSAASRGSKQHPWKCYWGTEHNTLLTSRISLLSSVAGRLWAAERSSCFELSSSTKGISSWRGQKTKKHIYGWILLIDGSNWLYITGVCWFILMTQVNTECTQIQRFVSIITVLILWLSFKSSYDSTGIYVHHN